MRERRTNGDDLTGRRGGYKELKGELHHFFRRIWIVIILIGVTSVGGLGGLGLLLRHEQQDARTQCQNRNIRHDNAIYQLIDGSNQDQLNTDDAITQEEIRRRRDVTIGLIDALAPKTDCDNPVPVKALPAVTPIPEE